MRFLKHVLCLCLLICFVTADLSAQKSFAKKKSSVLTNAIWDANGILNLSVARRFNDAKSEFQINVGVALADDISEAWDGGDSGYSYLWDGGAGLILTYRRYILRKGRGLFVQAQTKFFAPDWSYQENGSTEWTAVDNDILFNPAAHVGFKWNIGKGRVFITPFLGVNINLGDFESESGVVLRSEDGEVFGGGATSPDFGLNIGLNF
ncbi:MAG: hypothetical protein P8P48_00755 [Saprospiraceae bacterium]|nr:hypothetical protein [Saprospiraceae bacterium]